MRIYLLTGFESIAFLTQHFQVEKEKQRTSEETAKSLLEKSSLGCMLTKMEIENAALQEKVQNLQVKIICIDKIIFMQM